MVKKALPAMNHAVVAAAVAVVVAHQAVKHHNVMETLPSQPQPLKHREIQKQLATVMLLLTTQIQQKQHLTSQDLGVHHVQKLKINLLQRRLLVTNLQSQKRLRLYPLVSQATL